MLSGYPGGNFPAGHKRPLINNYQKADEQRVSKCRLFITRKLYDIAFIGNYGRDISQRHVKQLMPDAKFLPTDNGDDEIEMRENDKGSIMILDMGQTLKTVRFFNTFNPIKEVADANVEQLEIVLGYKNSELLKNIEMPECVKQNLLALFKFGRDGLAQQIGYQKTETRDVMLDSFVCFHFAQFLCSDHTASLQNRFSFINEMRSHEKILGDKYCSIFPVEIQDGVYRINNRNPERIEAGRAHRMYDNSVYTENIEEIPDFSSLSLCERNNTATDYSESQVKLDHSKPEAAALSIEHNALKAGVRLFFYRPESNAEPKSLFHSGVYLGEGYFIAKEGPANVVVTTIDNYMRLLSESYEHDQLIYAALPIVCDGSSFYGHLT